MSRTIKLKDFCYPYFIFLLVIFAAHWIQIPCLRIHYVLVAPPIDYIIVVLPGIILMCSFLFSRKELRLGRKNQNRIFVI